MAALPHLAPPSVTSEGTYSSYQLVPTTGALTQTTSAAIPAPPTQGGQGTTQTLAVSSEPGPLLPEAVPVPSGPLPPQTKPPPPTPQPKPPPPTPQQATTPAPPYPHGPSPTVRPYGSWGHVPVAPGTPLWSQASVGQSSSGLRPKQPPPGLPQGHSSCWF